MCVVPRGRHHPGESLGRALGAEPGRPMTGAHGRNRSAGNRSADPPAEPAAPGPLARHILSLADTKRLLGIRYSDWILGSPSIETGIAASSMAQDEWGHARLLYSMLKRLGFDPVAVEQDRPAERYYSAPRAGRPLPRLGGFRRGDRRRRRRAGRRARELLARELRARAFARPQDAGRGGVPPAVRRGVVRAACGRGGRRRRAPGEGGPGNAPRDARVASPRRPCLHGAGGRMRHLGGRTGAGPLRRQGGGCAGHAGDPPGGDPAGPRGVGPGPAPRSGGPPRRGGRAGRAGIATAPFSWSSEGWLPPGASLWRGSPCPAGANRQQPGKNRRPVRSAGAAAPKSCHYSAVTPRSQPAGARPAGAPSSSSGGAGRPRAGR